MNDSSEPRPEIDPARALEEAIARRERELEELARDFDRIEDEIEVGETDAEIARLIDLHAAEIARPRRGFAARASSAEGPGAGITAEIESRLASMEALQGELRSRLERLRIGQENLDRKVEGGFAALIEAQRRGAADEGVASARGGMALLRSGRHRMRLLLFGLLLAFGVVLWRWLAI